MGQFWWFWKGLFVILLLNHEPSAEKPKNRKTEKLVIRFFWFFEFFCFSRRGMFVILFFDFSCFAVFPMVLIENVLQEALDSNRTLRFEPNHTQIRIHTVLQPNRPNRPNRLNRTV